MSQTQADDNKQLIASLNQNPAWHTLKQWSHSQRDAYLQNLAQALWKDPDKVTEAALREKAAFFRGMNTVLNQPFFSAKALERAIESSTEESS